jgi:ribonuclease J
LAGVEVIDSSIQDNLHVSGHGGQVDMVRLAGLVKPKYLIPIGGTVTKMRKYRLLMSELGFDIHNVFECLEGDSIEFSKGVAKKGERVVVSPIYISTGKGDELAPQVIKDRDTLASDGVFVVVVGQDKKSGKIDPNIVEIVTRGFIYVKDSKELMDQSRKFIKKAISKRIGGKGGSEWVDMKRGLEKDIDRFLYKNTGRAPLIIVHALSM